MRVKCTWVMLVLMTGFAGAGYGQIEEDAVSGFYRLMPSGLSWCDAGEKATALRRALLGLLDSAAFYGLERSDYIPEFLQWVDSMVLAGKMRGQWQEWDDSYTKAAMVFARDVYEGAGVRERLSYDGVSELYMVRDEQYLAEGLAKVGTGADLREWLTGLVPTDAGYRVLRDTLAELTWYKDVYHLGY